MQRVQLTRCCLTPKYVTWVYINVLYMGFKCQTFVFSLLQQVPHLLLSTALLCAAVLEAGWTHSMELLGCLHPNMAVEAVGHYWGLCGHWSLGSQSPVQVDSYTCHSSVCSQVFKFSLQNYDNVHYEI